MSFSQNGYSISFDSRNKTLRTVRRLTNSDSATKNPYFPSKWKMYWWNNSNFEEYETVIFFSIFFMICLLQETEFNPLLICRICQTCWLKRCGNMSQLSPSILAKRSTK